MPPDRSQIPDPTGSIAPAAGEPGPSLARIVATRVRALRPLRRDGAAGQFGGQRLVEVSTDAASSRRSGLSIRTIRIIAALLLSIPLTTALAALALTSQELAATARLYPAAAPGLAREATMRAAAASRPAVAAALEGRTVSDILARIGRALPVDAELVSIARSADGTLRLEVETIDPEALRRSLAADPVLDRLRTTGESAIADRGVRVTLIGVVR